MEFITKRISKKVLAAVLTIAVLFTSVSASLFAFADLTEPYEVTLAEPAVPMTAGTLVYFDALTVEMEEGKEGVSGANLTWSVAEDAGITADNEKKYLTAEETGVYPVTVSDGTNTQTLYVVVKGAEDANWTLYHADWDNEEWNPSADVTKPLPEDWAYQIGGTNIGLNSVIQETNAVPHSAVKGVPDGANGILLTGKTPAVAAANKTANNTTSVFFTLNNPVVNAFKNYTVNANMLVQTDTVATSLTGRDGSAAVGFFVRAAGADENGKFTVGNKSSFNAQAFTVNVHNNTSFGGYAGYTLFNKFMRATENKKHTYNWFSVDRSNATAGQEMPAEINLSLKLEGAVATLNEAAGDVSVYEDVEVADRTGNVGVYVGYADGTYAVVRDFSVYLNNTLDQAPESCLICEVLPHSFTEYTRNNDQTCMNDETETAYCDYGCGTPGTRNIPGTKEEHIFIEYVADGNATETDRGTETAYCENDCGTTDTRDVSDIYKVKASAPAIPVNTNTAVKLADLEFEIDGTFVSGADVTFELLEEGNVTYADGVITVGADTGAFEAYVTSGETTVTVYVVAKHQNDDHWYIYDEDFTKSNYNPSGYNQIKIPENWTTQYTTSDLGGEYVEHEYVAPYSTTANPVTAGIIPLYNFYEVNNVEVKTHGGYFTLNNSVVSAFADYTIYAKMFSYNHENYVHAGVGLYGRAETDENGKLADISPYDNDSSSDRFTTIFVNNKDAGTYSTAVSWATFGDAGVRHNYGKAVEKWENLPIVQSNSNVGTYTRLSLKYDGSKATFTNLASPNTDSYTLDLTQTGDRYYDRGGAVGVYQNSFAAGHPWPTGWFALRRFSVALNNTKYDCPLYTVITPEKDLYPGDEDEQIKAEEGFEDAYLAAPEEDLGTADSGSGAAGGSSAYLVTQAAPAIPMINTTYINFSSLVFEWNGSKVGGSTIDIIKPKTETDGITIDNENRTITANKVGVYPVTVKKGPNYLNAYVVVKTYNDNRWYLYDKDFTTGNWNASGYGKIAVPEGWQVQYAKDAFHGGGTALPSHVIPVATHVAPYSTTGNVTNGIIPFYNQYEENSSAAQIGQFGFFTLNDENVNHFADYTIIAKTVSYNPYGDQNESGVGLYGRVDMQPLMDGKITDWDSHGSWNTDRFSVFYVNNGTGSSSKDVYQVVYGDGAYRQKEVTRLGNFANLATTGSDNNGVQLDMRLKYAGDTATFTAGTQYVEHDLSKDKTRYDLYYDVPGGVGFYAGWVGAKSAENTTWSSVQRFSVTLNNEKVDGKNVDCPYFYKTANFDPGAEVEEETKAEETVTSGNKKDPKVKKVTITAGFKINYFVGEAIDLNGGQITVAYTDGKKEVLDITEDMLTGFDTSAPGQYTVTITYGGKEATFTINVTENPNTQTNSGDANNNTAQPQQTVTTYNYVQDLTILIIIILAAMMLLLIIGAVVIIIVSLMSRDDDDDDDLDLDDIDLDDYDLDDYDDL